MKGGGVICVALAFYPGACRVVSSIGAWWARFVLWVTTFPFLKFLPGFGTRYKFLDLDVFDFNIYKYFSCCECLSLSLYKLSLLLVFPLVVLDPLFFVLFSSLLLVNFTLHGANLFVLFSLLSRLKFYKLTWLVKEIFGASRIIGEKHQNSSTTLQQDVVVHRDQTVVSLQRNSGICSALL